MTNTHARFVGSIPENYDRYLGPLLFEYYALDLAQRVTVPDNAEVLEIASGTSISTQFLREALPQTVRVLATDLNPAMLDYARKRRGGLANVSFEQADGQDLPFESRRFDAVVCQFGVMFFPDKAAGMREVARVLRPGGSFAFNVWDSIDKNPVARVAHNVVAGCFAGNPPAFCETPFGYHDPAAIHEVLTEAGFADIEIQHVAKSVRRPAARDVATGFVMGTPLYVEIVERGTARPEQVIDAVTEALQAEFGDAPLRANLQAIVVTARASVCSVRAKNDARLTGVPPAAVLTHL